MALGGALAAGIGIVGHVEMRAYSLPIPIGFDPTISLFMVCSDAFIGIRTENSTENWNTCLIEQGDAGLWAG